MDSIVRITVQLVETRTGTLVKSFAAEGHANQLWTIQRDISNALLDEVHNIISRPKNSNRAHHVNSEAFELCLRGRHLAASWEQLRQKESIRLFERAIIADPHYPTPYVGKAQCLLRIAQLGLVRPRDIISTVRKCLEEALALDPMHAEAEGTLAVLTARHEWKWRDAERRFARAVDLAPFSAEIHNNYAFDYLAATGSLDEALAANRRAREIDPFSPSAMTDFPWLL